MAISRRDLLQTAAGTSLLGVMSKDAAAEDKARINKSKGWSPRKFKKKPNIVIAILDDVGFGDLGCFGSEIDTRHIDALAKAGVRYNNFHVTALCAPTRACLMTGQNAHKVGVGNIAEWGRPLPGYRGYIREDVKLLPQMLKDADYNTIAVGKWHMSMVNDQDAMGPFDHWPIGRGFDHWYGFHGSAVDHWHPELFRNQAQISPDKSENYHLTEDLVDQSIAYVKDHKVATPEKPFFLYLGFGACHFPFHAPKSYIDKYNGIYEAGYDAMRPGRLKRQKELGVVPSETKLSPRPDDIPPWLDLPADEQRFSVRTEQAFSGMLDHADDQLGRLVEVLEEMGELDDTILIVMSDNGAGGGYHRAGALDVRRIAYIGPETVEEKMKSLEDVGSERSNSLYSTGWSFLGNTPLKRRKGDTYEGGIRTPMIIHWPNGNLPEGSIHGQYHHIVDMVPTLLEMTNSDDIKVETDGTSLAYSLDSGKADTLKTHQHYETAGDRAIWAGGWKAVTLHQKGTEFKDDVWALYHADKDFSELNNLTDEEPKRLKKLVKLWEQEAKANNVLPLNDELDGLYANVAPKPRPHYVFYPGQTRFNRLTAPDIFRYDFDVIARFETSDSDDMDGVVLASGDSAAGYELFIKDGFAHFHYVFTRRHTYALKTSRRVSNNTKSISLTGSVSGKGQGKIVLKIDGQSAGTLELPNMWKVEALNAGIRCGENKGAPISFAYKGSNPLKANLIQVDLTLKIRNEI